MRVAGFDMGSKMGWALGEAGGRPDYGVWKLKDPKDDIEKACEQAASLFNDMCRIEQYAPQIVAIEKPIPPFQQGAGKDNPIKRNMASMMLPQQVYGAIRGLCRCYGIDVVGVNMQTVRSHFTGRARWGSPEATKEAVLRRCRALGYVPLDYRDDNAADALAVWDWACAIHARVPPKELVLFNEDPL